MLEILDHARPDEVWTHNPLDRHSDTANTHVATLIRLLAAIRQMDPNKRPTSLYGGSVTGQIDWNPQAEIVDMTDPEGYKGLARMLLNSYQTQSIKGNGRDYPTLIMSLWRNNSQADRRTKGIPTEISYMINMSELIQSGEALADWSDRQIATFAEYRKKIIDEVS